MVQLAQVAAQHGGLYDSHIRDESSYNVGLLAAIEEAIEIGRRGGLPVHIAHIKALGADVWGESEAVIERIEQANAAGLRVTADQYPWQASGTHLDNALLPRWIKVGTQDEFLARLKDPSLQQRLRDEMSNNLRRRGGAEALLIAAGPIPGAIGKTLGQYAEERGAQPIDTALDMFPQGRTRVISFNMKPMDIENYMRQPWVMTSSDGTHGHPRKYASFPMKYRKYVREKPVISLAEYVYRSSGLVAETFGIINRGHLRVGYFADIGIIDLERYGPRASFESWNVLSEGVEYLLVNGEIAIDGGKLEADNSGRVLLKRPHS